MPIEPIQRLIPDRRRSPRGGRRPADVEGLTPLVFVVGGEPQTRQMCETILAKLRFAVAAFASFEAARTAIDALRPEVILAPEAGRKQVLFTMPPGYDIPMVALPDSATPEAVVNAVRQALRPPES